MNTPTKQPDPGSDSGENNARFSLSSSLQHYLNSSLGLIVWVLFLFCGGLVFAVYYARIGYLPEIELNSALFYLAAASIIGGSLVVLLTLLLIVPGFIWVRYMINDSPLENAFCDDSDVLIPGKFFVRLVLPFFLFAVAAHSIASSHYRWPSFLFLILIGLGKGSWIWKWEIRDCLGKNKEKDTKARPEGNEKKRRLFFLYAFRYGISVFSVVIASITLSRLMGLSEIDPSDTRRVIAHFVICTVGVVAANTTVTVFLHGSHKAGAVASAVIFSLALIAATDHFDPVPEKILRNYGFGVDSVQMIISEDTYKALRAGNIVKRDDPSPGPKAVSGVTILCRMGPNYFLKIEDKKVVLAKSNVISWSVEQKP